MKKIVEAVGELILPAVIVFVAVVFLQSFDMIFFNNSIFNFLEGLVNARS